LRGGVRCSMEGQAQSVGNAKIREEFEMEAATRVAPNTNSECFRRDLVESNSFLGRDEALSLLTQWIARLPPLIEESISDALSRAYTIV
jgi:hypothetical protein